MSAEMERFLDLDIYKLRRISSQPGRHIISDPLNLRPSNQFPIRAAIPSSCRTETEESFKNVLHNEHQIPRRTNYDESICTRGFIASSDVQRPTNNCPHPSPAIATTPSQAWFRRLRGHGLGILFWVTFRYRTEYFVTMATNVGRMWDSGMERGCSETPFSSPLG